MDEKPDLRDSTNANGSATDHKCQSLRASEERSYAGRGSFRISGEAGALLRGEYRSMPSITSGTRSAAKASAVSATAAARPWRWLRAASTGVTRKPAALAPFSAKLIASPRFRSNHNASTVEIAAIVVQTQPQAITSAAP